MNNKFIKENFNISILDLSVSIKETIEDRIQGMIDAKEGTITAKPILFIVPNCTSIQLNKEYEKYFFSENVDLIN